MTDEQYIAELEAALENLGWLFNDTLAIIKALQSAINVSDDDVLIDDADLLLAQTIPGVRDRFEAAFPEDSEYVKRMKARYAE